MTRCVAVRCGDDTRKNDDIGSIRNGPRKDDVSNKIDLIRF